MLEYDDKTDVEENRDIADGVVSTALSHKCPCECFSIYGIMGAAHCDFCRNLKISDGKFGGLGFSLYLCGKYWKKSIVLILAIRNLTSSQRTRKHGGSSR